MQSLQQPKKHQRQHRQSPQMAVGVGMPFQFSFRLTNGTVEYFDEKAKTKAEIRGINFDLQDILPSINRLNLH